MDAALQPGEGSRALKYRACAQNVSDLVIVSTFCDAGLHTDEGSIALKCRACAQNVSDTIHILYFLESCPTPRNGDKCSQVPCLRTKCVRRYYRFFILGCWPTPR
jgi:hypothetical protein